MIHNFDTPSTLENHGQTKELFNHNIECPNNKILKQYKFIRTGENPNKFYYNFKCVDNPNKNNDVINKQTNLNDYGNGQSIYIDRHHMICPPTHALSKIQLTGQPDNDPKQIQYNYRCTDAHINNTTNHDTIFNDDGHKSIIFFDRHNIKCPDISVLNSVKLQRSIPTNQFRFEYTCGTSGFVQTRDNYYVNSNNVDNKVNGHIKSHIQSLILYYGFFTKKIELDSIILSKGGELATHVVYGIHEYIKSIGAQHVWRGTQSDSWCPLIWKALQFAGKKIKREWTLFVPAQHFIDQIANQFSQMPGWVEYVDYILTQYIDIGFENSFDNAQLQNESKKIKLHLRLHNAQNIDNKNEGHINTEIQNIIQYYVFNNSYECNSIFAEAATFNGIEPTYSIIFVPLIWKALKLAGYNIPDNWIQYRKVDKQNQAEQHIFNNFAERLSRINGFNEFALYTILDYNDIHKYNDMRELKYIKHQEDINVIINRIDSGTQLNIIEQIKYLYKLNEHTMYGGNEYKQKYIKYKQKYLNLLNR